MVQSPISRYIMLIRRWAWVVILGIVICCSVTFLAGKLTRPVYQASAVLVINLDMSTPGNTTSSLAAVPTYAQLLTNPTVLQPVVAQHRGLTVQQLSGMLTAKPQSNTQLIELDVQNGDPQLAAQLANEICKSFALYADSQLPGTVQILPAQRPVNPIKPQPLQDTGIAALVSLGLAVALIFIFEWIDDRMTSPDEVRMLLGTELLAVIPRLLQKQRKQYEVSEEVAAESYHRLCANLNAAQAAQSFKLVMVTSALAGEGKSTVAANLASFLAMAGKKVLLVDANLHCPMLSQRFQVNDQLGLSAIFTDMLQVPTVELSGQETCIPNLYLLPAGRVLTRPAELLQSPLASSLFDYFKHAPFDYVIVDAPPVLTVADVQIMAPLVHTIILVCDAHKTPRRALQRVKYELSKVYATVSGVVINKSCWSDYADPPRRLVGEEQAQVDISVFPSTHTSPTIVVPAHTSAAKIVGSSRSPHPLKLPSIPLYGMDNSVVISHQPHDEMNKQDKRNGVG